MLAALVMTTAEEMRRVWCVQYEAPGRMRLYLVPSRPRFLSLARRERKERSLMRKKPKPPKVSMRMDGDDLIVLDGDGVVVRAVAARDAATAGVVVVVGVVGTSAPAHAEDGEVVVLLRVAQGVEVADVEG